MVATDMIEENEEKTVKEDSNGNILQDGDSVILIKIYQGQSNYRIEKRYKSEKYSFSRRRSRRGLLKLMVKVFP